MSSVHVQTLLTFVSSFDNNAVVKNLVSGNSPSIKTMAGVSAFFRFRQSWLLSGPGNLPKPRVGKLPLFTGGPKLFSPWAQWKGCLSVYSYPRSRQYKILNGLIAVSVSDLLIAAEESTSGGHKQSLKHIRALANTSLGQNSFFVQSYARLVSSSTSCYWIQINSSFEEPTEQ